MSIASIKVGSPDPAAHAAVTRPTGDAGDFAAVARSASASAAMPAPASAAPAASTASNGVSALAALLAEGDLAAAHAALEQLGVHAAPDDRKGAAEPAATTKAAIADVASTPAKQAADTGRTVVDAASTAQPAADIDVHQVLLALATGNAGGLPADVINLYGPGGARYDPAAIMEAYRASAIGQSQMAAAAWIGKLA